VTKENVFPKKRKALLGNDEIKWLQDVVHQRDINNEGMSRKEVVKVIAEVGRCPNLEKAEYHLNYLIRKKALNRLKREGRVVTAQSTTSERSQISIPQQYRWHVVIGNVWSDMRRKNLPSSEFKRLQPHFQMNFDEACFMCSEGTLKVLAAADRKKHNLNLADDRSSMTLNEVD